MLGLPVERAWQNEELRRVEQTHEKQIPSWSDEELDMSRVGVMFQKKKILIMLNYAYECFSNQYA